MRETAPTEGADVGEPGVATGRNDDDVVYTPPLDADLPARPAVSVVP